MKVTRLRTWVKLLITVIALIVILYLRNIVMTTNIDLNYRILYWFIFIPFNFIVLELMWER